MNLLILMVFIANASEYKSYVFQYKTEILTIKESSSDEGFKKAANHCFDYYSKNLKNEELDDLIDVCANPK